MLYNNKHLIYYLCIHIIHIIYIYTYTYLLRLRNSEDGSIGLSPLFAALTNDNNKTV